jgi:hypothetical protein
MLASPKFSAIPTATSPTRACAHGSPRRPTSMPTWPSAPSSASITTRHGRHTRRPGYRQRPTRLGSTDTSHGHCQTTFRGWTRVCCVNLLAQFKSVGGAPRADIHDEPVRPGGPSRTSATTQVRVCPSLRARRRACGRRAPIERSLRQLIAPVTRRLPHPRPPGLLVMSCDLCRAR